MTDLRPVRLTFPSYDEGMADIFADGERVGIALANNKDWTAYLYLRAGSRRVREGGEEEVTAGKLGELREALRERIALKGPWWTS